MEPEASKTKSTLEEVVDCAFVWKKQHRKRRERKKLFLIGLDCKVEEVEKS